MENVENVCGIHTIGKRQNSHSIRSRFLGDLQSIPLEQVTKGPVDYLMMDLLAEVAMSMLTTGIDSLTAHEMKKENK